MKLRSDPFEVFRSSKTPAGLYARKKWLMEPTRSAYTNDFDETVSVLLSGQARDGSWGTSAIRSVRRLFGLHLTIRDQTEPVRRGLDWLMGQTRYFNSEKASGSAEEISAKALNGLPFAMGARFLLTSCAALFLASVFGRGDDPKVLQVYERLAAKGTKGSGRWCGWASYSNILRAFVVHPQYAGSEAVKLMVKNLKGIQNASGTWEGAVPFYQTVNALAHLESSEGNDQLSKAFEYLRRVQKTDGTWGRSQPEWNTFLIIHALKNKGEL